MSKLDINENMKIGITGAEGTIGSVLRKGLSNKYKNFWIENSESTGMPRAAGTVAIQLDSEIVPGINFIFLSLLWFK